MHAKSQLIWAIRLARAMGVVRKLTSSYIWRKPVFPLVVVAAAMVAVTAAAIIIINRTS